MGQPLSGTRETWLAPNVLMTLFSRPTPHAAARRDQPGQVVRGPSPAGSCVTPTAELEKTKRDPLSTSRPSIFSMTSTQAVDAENWISSPRTRAAQPSTSLQGFRGHHTYLRKIKYGVPEL